MSKSVSLQVQLSALPDNPGVYQFYDADGKILYVGKAKNLKKRVSSYFNKKQEYGKTRVLVKKIRSIKHIVVPTESDALLLENNLIKNCCRVTMYSSRTISPTHGYVLKTSGFQGCFPHGSS